MRNSIAVTVIVLCLVNIALSVAEIVRHPGGGKKRVKQRATHQELVERQRATRPATHKKKVQLEDVRKIPHRKSNRSRSLIARSTIISHNRHWTIVPKGSVLHVPAYFRARIDGKHRGELLPWPRFLAKNRNWISMKPVTMPQARGEAPIPPETVESFRKLGRVVVASRGGGPISVKAPVEPADAPPVRTAGRTPHLPGGMR